jgi:hypothetical protein
LEIIATLDITKSQAAANVAESTLDEVNKSEGNPAIVLSPNAAVRRSNMINF